VVTANGPMTLKGNTWTKAAVNLRPAPVSAVATPRVKVEPAKANPQPDDPGEND
jgi:hypothetical protein